MPLGPGLGIRETGVGKAVGGSPIPNRQSPITNPPSPIPNPQSPIPNPQSPIPHPGYSMTTIFHKIIRRQIPADLVYEDDDIIAFRDIAPQAPVHVLFVPKTDVATLNDLLSGQAEIVGRLALAAAGARQDAHTSE